MKEIEIQQTLTTTTATTSSPTNPNNSNGGLSFSNGVFTALISDASTWNVDAVIVDVCGELRVYPPSSMLESRKVSDNGEMWPGGGRSFEIDKPIGIRQVIENRTAVHGTRFSKPETSWPIRILGWPKRDIDDNVVNYKFEFFEPPPNSYPGQELGYDSPSLGSVDYSNPKKGREPLCVVTSSGADSDCKLRRISRENKGADGSTIGGTA